MFGCKFMLLNFKEKVSFAESKRKCNLWMTLRISNLTSICQNIVIGF